LEQEIAGGMMVEEHRSTFDPEFDPPAARSRPAGAWDDTDKRLIVNPFLVLVDWLAAYAFFRAAIMRVDFTMFQIGAALLLVSSVLCQYHCLDCGATGWLVRHRRHRCPEAVARSRIERPRRWHIPGVAVQIVVWGYLVAMAVALYLILSR
jgi:hypothetical protein